jgi:ATP-dependent protease ClpP protease subunit
MTERAPESESDPVPDPAPGPPPVAPKKTPFFQAVNSPRYSRQSIIREIQTLTGGNKLICYVAGQGAPVHREDVVCLVDLLHNIPANHNVDLLLHTGGGDIDAAEKIITMIRKRVGSARLRIVVPDYAKSAGTLIALGADSIVMSESSELGPIDPQVVMSDGNSNRIQISVKNYLDAYNEHAAALKQDPTDVAAQLMLGKLDPVWVKLFRGVMRRAQEFAESLLKQGMLKNGNWTQAVDLLLNGTKFLTHGQPILWEDASDKKINLTIEHLDPDDLLWQKYWVLYCLQAISVKSNEKLFESEIASVCIETMAV